MCWQFVVAHLSFLQFILQEGGLYLPWHRARDIWDTLVASPQASDWDRDVSLSVYLHSAFGTVSRFSLLVRVYMNIHDVSVKIVPTFLLLCVCQI